MNTCEWINEVKDVKPSLHSHNSGGSASSCCKFGNWLSNCSFGSTFDH